MKQIVITLIALLFAAPLIIAQSAIDNAIKALEKDKSTQYVVYSEKRNPTTSKIYKSSKVLVVTSKQQLKRLIDSFEKEREKTVSFEKQPGRVYVAKFSKNKERREYVLYRQADGSWLLTVEIVIPENARTARTRRTSTPVGEAGEASFTVFI